MIRKLSDGLVVLIFVIVVAYSFYTRNWILGIYLFYLFGFIIYAVVGLSMVKKYGFIGDASRIVLAVFPVLSVVIIVATLVLILS